MSLWQLVSDTVYPLAASGSQSPSSWHSAIQAPEAAAPLPVFIQTQAHPHRHTHPHKGTNIPIYTHTFAAGWESLGPPVATSLWSYPSMCAHIQTTLGLVPSDPQTPRSLQWLAGIPLVCLTASFSCGLILTDTYPTMAPRPPYLLAD